MGWSQVVNVISIVSEEMDGSPSEGLAEDGGFQGRRVLRCDWPNRVTLAKELRGYWTRVGSNYQWHKPHPYPHAAEASEIVCTSVQIHGVGRIQEHGGDAQIAAYEKAGLVAQYGQRPTLVRERYEPAAEYLQIEPKAVGWAADQPIDPAVAPRLLIHSGVWVVENDQLPGAPSADMGDLIGKINSDAVAASGLGAGFSFGVGTLLYEPPTLDQVLSLGGIIFWRGVFRFAYRPHGWNYFPKVSGTSVTWAKLHELDNASELDVYESAAFADVRTDIFGS